MHRSHFRCPFPVMQFTAMGHPSPLAQHMANGAMRAIRRTLSRQMAVATIAREKSRTVFDSVLNLGASGNYRAPG